METYSIDFLTVFSYFDVFVRGLIGTIKLAGASLICGLGFGLFLGAARWSKRKVFNWPATAYIETVRNTPALVQIMWFFYAFPILVGQNMSPFTAGWVALSLNTAAFSAEIFRAGIQSIDVGQWEAGKAIGMNFITLMRRVILPQAIKRMIPSFTNRAIELTKMTSLASTIAFGDLMYEGKLLSATLYRPIEIYTVVATIYFIILYAGTIVVRRFELKKL